AGGQLLGNNGVSGLVRAGGSAPIISGNGGGMGGTVCLDGAAGITLGGGSSAGIDATGGQSGCGGCIALATDVSGADLTVTAPLGVGALGLARFAGEAEIAAAGAAVRDRH